MFKDFCIATVQVALCLTVGVGVIMGFVWLGTHNHWDLVYRTKTPYGDVTKTISSGLSYMECDTVLSNFKDQTNYECINSWKNAIK